MDKMCNSSELEGLNKTITNVDDLEVDAKTILRCESPVFKCVNQFKPTRGCNSESDNDIPSYQGNQTAKSRTSSKCGNETSDSVLPFSPIFSPIPVPLRQCQPPSVHTLGSLVKRVNGEKSFRNITSVKEVKKACSAFESLGMTDKDISWVSSMASPPPFLVPGSQFNTVEKATFLPEEKFLNIQPRALFSPTRDDDLGCNPLMFSSESEDEETYKTNMRLSDVCATLRQLEVKSVELVTTHTENETIAQESGLKSSTSPIIRTIKTKKSVLKKKKDILVRSPEPLDKYDFFVSENLESGLHERVKSNEKSKGNNKIFIEDDSFQSISFTCIDELCKTLVDNTGQPETSVSQSSECNRTVVSSIHDLKSFPKQNSVCKQFYISKTNTDVYAVSSLDNLHSNTKALIEGELDILEGNKIDKSITDKGIVRFDVLDKDSSKVDATKRLCSDLSEGKKVIREKKFKKEISDSSWDTMSKYLSESQLNVSDSDIFRTVEKLEKTLCSQEGNVPEEEKKKSRNATDVLQKSPCKSDQDLNSVNNGDEIVSSRSVTSKESLNVESKTVIGVEASRCENTTDDSDKPSVCFDIFKGFSTASGNKVIISDKSLEKAKELMSKCVEDDFQEIDSLATKWMKAIANPTNHKTKVTEKFNEVPAASLSTLLTAVSSPNRTVLEKTFLKGKDLSDEGVKKGSEDMAVSKCMEGFSTCSRKSIQVSADALEKAKTLSKRNEKMKETSDELASSWVVGFATESVEEKKMQEFMGFSTASGSKVTISEKALVKGREFMAKCDKDEVTGRWKNYKSMSAEKESISKSDEVSNGLTNSMVGFTTGLGNPIKISEESHEKAKVLMSECEKTEKGAKEAKGFSTDEGQIISPFLGFSTAAGSKVTISEVALAKAKELMATFDQNLPEVSRFDPVVDSAEQKNFVIKTLGGECSTKTEVEESTSKLSTTGIDESGVTNLTEADWDKIIPSWLHVYNTSPSIASDRVDLSPVVSHEDGKSSKPESEYVVRSPVLGTSDRFYKKIKRKKLQFESNKQEEPTCRSKNFTVPYKNGGRKSSAKRNLANLSMDFSAPFKKAKLVEEKSEKVLSGVKEAREVARLKQEKVAREKEKVKPLKGSYLSKKSSERQMKWREAVEGCKPEVHSVKFLKSMGVKDNVLRVDVENAASFRFNGKDFYGSTCLNNVDGIPVGDGCLLILDDENKAGVEEFERAFLASLGVEPKLVPVGWVENHYKWIVWKLAHYERSLPVFFGGRALTPNNVMLQLKYRYDRDIDRNERSALKKILERDDTSAKRMVLCVCGIKKVPSGEMTGYELNLTDGWYSCPARPDFAMARLIEEGKVFIGMKLVIQGAILVNCEQGMSPLEISGHVYLKIFTNSTRRIRWDTKLGFQKNSGNIKVSLGSILPRGGQISRVDVIIVRVYPVLYMEKTLDGHHVTRNRRTEEKVDAEYRKLQEQKLESIYSEIRSEIQKWEEMAKENNLSSQEAGDLPCESSSDPSTLQEQMLASLKQKKDGLSRAMSDRLEQKLKNENLHKRNVSEFLRVKMVDFHKRDYNNPAILSVWNPKEEVCGLFSEGKVISLTNVTVSNSSWPFKLNTTRQTQYREMVVQTGVEGKFRYPARQLTPLAEVSSKSCALFEEVDVVGIVVLTRDVSYGSRSSQIIYLTDLEFHFVGILFWGSCKDYCWENVLTLRSIVACSNLLWKTSCSLEEIPCLHVTVHSLFTQNPKHSHLKTELERLKNKMPEDVTSFLSKCEEELMDKVEKSKWPANTSRNASAFDSSLKDGSSGKPRPLNGFESRPTASSTPIRSFSVGPHSSEAEPSPIQKRIEKLQSYGEPPPLFPIILSNRSRKLKKKF